jgi:glycosyltransferase involved in cell wall biosynthesis
VADPMTNRADRPDSQPPKKTSSGDSSESSQLRKPLQFHVRLAESPVTRKKGELLRAAGVEVGYYRHFNVEFLRRNISRVRDRILRRTVRTLPWYDEIGKLKPDLVWFNVDGLGNFLEIEYGVRLCRRHNVPYWIVLQHAAEDFFFSAPEAAESAAQIATGAKRFVFIAKRNRESLERAIGLRLENAFHSANALSPAEFDRALSVEPRGSYGHAHLYNLGRYSPKDKGQHLIVEALSGDAWESRDWTMSFVGVDAAGREQIERMGAHFGVPSERLTFVAFTEDAYPEIARHDVLVMPSLAEGTPFAMIESMAAGRPAVGTPVGGIPELIRDRETGWLARTVDVNDIAEALERMWADRERWPLMGTAARQHVLVNNNEERTHSELLHLLKSDAAA